MSDAARITGLEKALAKLRKEFEQFQKSLHVSQPRQQHDAGASPKGAANQKNDTARWEVSLSSQVNPSPGNTAQAQNPWYKTAQGWKQRLEIAGIVFAIGYAIVTFFQWRDLRKNFEASERSWTYVDMGPFPEFKDELPFTITNPGKVPIQTAFVYTWMEILNYKTAPSFDPRRETVWTNEVTFIAPNRPFTSNAMRRRNDGTGPWPATPDELRSLRDGTDYVTIYGIIAYKDEFGKHWTKFCYYQSFNPTPIGVDGYNARSCGRYQATGDGDIAIPSIYTKH